MRTDWNSLNQREQVDFTVLTALLSGRLASVETIHWALAIKHDEAVKRIAVLNLIDSSQGRKLGEPWRSTWRMIEEAWDNPEPGHVANLRPYDIRERVQSGDRSGSLIAAIADYVAPRLKVSAASRWPKNTGEVTKRPRTVAQIVSWQLASGKLVDPHIAALDEIEEGAFLAALANALEGALVRGLDTARRLGWDGERRLYRLGQLHRVCFIRAEDRKPGEQEPDEFHEGIAPCVKLLHFVAERLGKRGATVARSLVNRWKLAPTPVHLRLWAALARDGGLVDANDVGRGLQALDDRQFWDIQNFPEVAELRALRFAELDAAVQKTLLKRLRKAPPRSHWPRDADHNHVAQARLSIAARELRRIEAAGGTLAHLDKGWLTDQLKHFPALVPMIRLDEGFLGTSGFVPVTPQPDTRYDNLSGNERLSALESALDSARRGWHDDASSRAGDWMRIPGNAARLISDFEVSDDAGSAYPKVWDQFGWTHSPAANLDQTQPVGQETEAEVGRVLALLLRLSETTVRTTIEGLSSWLSNWQTVALRSSNALRAWQRLWPIAVEATNSAQSAGVPIDLNIVAPSSADHEPMDLDTLNTPVGRLVGMFLAACPRVDGKYNPFAIEGVPRTMRETIMTATGRSGLIVRHRLIEHLPYFMIADPEWAPSHLIAPLLAANDDAISLWRALARQTHFTKVLKFIGPAMVARASKPALGRETRRSLVFSLVVESLRAFLEAREPAVSHVSIQQMLRALDDELRAYAAGVVQRFVREAGAEGVGSEIARSAESLFERAAVPFLKIVWPQERSLSTPGVSKAFADLPATARGAFAAAVQAIDRFLVPFDSWSLVDYGLFGDDNGEPRLALIDTTIKASALLRLLDATIGISASAVIPYDLAAALARIEEVAPHLERDPKFRRLTAAARR